MPTPFLLFAEAVAPPGGPAPTWTDKEVLVAVLSLVGASIPAIWGIVKFFTVRETRKREEAEADNQMLWAENAELRAGKGPEIEALEEERTRLKVAWGLQTEELADVREKADGYRRAAEAAEKEAIVVIAERDEAREELKGVRIRIAKAADKDGAIWAERVLANAPKFAPLDEEGRRTPIISFLNLKGGVGKTTAVAHLGAAFASFGYRVLLIDLDLQGSLTGLFLTGSEQCDADDAGRQIGEFFDAAFDSEYPKLTEHAVPVPFPTKSALVPTTDNLAYAETNMMVRWFLREGKDPRFLLRRELHLRKVTAHFDVVLLDCPPLLNVSCVNALAASDFLVVPTVPSKQSTDRVSTLMQRVKEIRRAVNPDLAVVGFFANRTKNSTMTAEERDLMTALRNQCGQALGHPVRWLEAFVRQSADVRDAEADRKTFGSGDHMFPAFEALAREIESNFPMFCRPVSATASVPVEEVEA